MSEQNADPGATWSVAVASNGAKALICTANGRPQCFHDLPQDAEYTLFGGLMVVAAKDQPPYVLTCDGATETIKP